MLTAQERLFFVWFEDLFYYPKITLQCTTTIADDPLLTDVLLWNAEKKEFQVAPRTDTELGRRVSFGSVGTKWIAEKCWELF